jgi:hypothetical protein
LLDLHSNTINQQGLDVLLQYGTCITTLVVSSFDLSASRSDKACSWKSLEFEKGPISGFFLRSLAYLSLRGVHTISRPEYAEDFPESLDHLHVPLLSFKTAAQRDLLRAAAVNVAASKAWQDCPATSVTLIASRGGNRCLGEVLCALAPLGGAHIRSLSIKGIEDEEDDEEEEDEEEGTNFKLNKAEVEALATSFGSAITSIYLNYCKPSSDFWPALARCFPAVPSSAWGHGYLALTASTWPCGPYSWETLPQLPSDPSAQACACVTCPTTQGGMITPAAAWRRSSRRCTTMMFKSLLSVLVRMTPATSQASLRE